jgi:hypothetical protein
LFHRRERCAVQYAGYMTLAAVFIQDELGAGFDVTPCEDGDWFPISSMDLFLGKGHLIYCYSVFSAHPGNSS